ncbi:MAG: hypothetical protein LC135_01020 [Phycisphaerae bacterium]|jgi:hypothetical protein|nr:hypothetical protein [Phycisphaerae bacterium]MCZ2398433.1 hypothetical protein [Phycisphaerae bacterium]NUQ50541.1 hypothetical protein [Phycisphaerae bacterium]
MVITADQAERPRRGRRCQATRRAAHRLPCTVRVGDCQSPGSELSGVAVVVSADQIVLLLPENPQPGTRIETSIWPQACDAVNLCGHVVSSRRVLTGTYEVGVKLG